MNGTVVTNDRIALRYTEAGAGRPLVLVHGWQQSAQQFCYQIEELSTRCRVIVYDQRGHGESAKPDHGYTVHRLAKDLHEMLAALDLSDVVLAGHSLGCMVAWAYLELFGTERLAKLVFIDCTSFPTSNPVWSPQTRADAGAVLTPDEVTATANALANPQTRESAVRGVIDSLFTSRVDPRVKEWVVGRNLLMAGEHSAALFYNQQHQDWREQIKRITLPTLVVSGRASLFPWTGMRWIAEQIPGAQLEIFEEAEGGSHFMFLENPTKFNALIADFMK